MSRLGVVLVVVTTGWMHPSSVSSETLSLADCIERALEHNTQVRVSEESVRRSLADVRSARASRLPSATATAFGFSRVRTGSSVRVQENPTGDVDPVTGQRILREEETLIPGIDRNDVQKG